MALTATVKTELYRFFSIAFDAAPGVTYMNQLAEAANAGMTVPQIVEVFTAKPQFTAVYPLFLTNQEFAAKLVGNVIGSSASDAAKAEAAADVAAALGAGWSKGKVIYQIFTNLASLTGDAKWGGTAAQLANEVIYAQYFTETLMRDTTDLPTLQAAIAGVTATSATTPEALAAALNPSSMTFALTNNIDVATANIFNATPVYVPNGDDFINSLQDEDRLTGTGTNPTLNVTLGSVNDAAETLITPELIGISTVNAQVTSNANRAGISFQDSTGLTNLNLTRLTPNATAAGAAATSTSNFLDLPATASTINLSNATRGGIINFTFKEDVLTGTSESIAVGINSVRAQAVNINEGTDGGTDAGFFFETVNITTNGGVDIDGLTIQQNGREDAVAGRTADTTKQVVNLTVSSGSTEINTLTATGADTLNIVADGPLVVAADPSAIVSTAADGMNAGDLESIVITGASNVRLDAVEMQAQPAAPAAPVTRAIDGSAMTGDLRLGVTTGTAGDAQLTITSGSGNDEIRFSNAAGGAVTGLGGSVSTGVGNDTVGGGTGYTTPSLNATASVTTGAGNDVVVLGAFLAQGDDATLLRNNNANDVAARLDTGEGNDTVTVGNLASAISWNDGSLIDSNVDDTFVVIGASVNTGDGDDTVVAGTVAEGASISTGAGADSLTVEVVGGSMIAADTNPDATTVSAANREVTASSATTADRMGGMVSLGDGNDTITYRDTTGSFTEGAAGAAGANAPFITATTIVDRDGQLDAGAGDDVLNVTALDAVTVADPTGAAAPSLVVRATADTNATILGVETINLTVANQIADDPASVTSTSRTVNETLGNVAVNDGNLGDDANGAITLDVLRVDSSLARINLVSAEQAQVLGAGGEQYQAGTVTTFTLNNYRSAVALTLTANEATGVSPAAAGTLTDDTQFTINSATAVATTNAAARDVVLNLDVADGELTNNTVTLTVNSGTAEQATNGGMDLDITLNATATDLVTDAASTTDDNAARVENLAIVLNDGRDHSLNLNGFGDAPFRATVPGAAGDVSSTAATSLQVWSGAAAGRTIAVNGVTADSIAFRTVDGAAVTTANVMLRVSDTNNYNISTGSGTDIIDMRADDVRSDDTLTAVSRADSISAGAGRDTMIVSNGDSIGRNDNAAVASTIIDDDVFGSITSLERIVTDADSGVAAAQMITLDEMARATGVDTLQFVSTAAAPVANQTSTIVIGNNFTVAAGNGNGQLTAATDALIVDAARHNGGVTTLNIENKDDDTDTDIVNLDIRASGTGGATINLVNSGSESATVEMRITTTSTASVANVITATNAGNANGLVDINVTTGSFDKLVVLEGAVGATAEAAGGDTITIAANWTRNDTTTPANNLFTLDASALADTDANAATGGLTVTADPADNARLNILTGANSDNITGSNQADTVSAGAGNDTVAAGSGADSVDGGAGNDTIDGAAGNDTLVGGAGADTLFGGLGADSLDGGANDSASDVFRYTAVEQSVQSTADTLANFTTGSDKVAITLSLTPAVGSAVNLGRFAEVGNVGEGDNSLDGTTASPRHMDAFYSTSGQLAIDVNGDGDITDIADIVINSAGRIAAGDINYTLTLGAGTTIRLGQGVDNLTLGGGTNTIVVVGSLGATTDVVNYTNAGATVVTGVANVRDVVQYNDLLTARGGSEANTGDVINASAGGSDTLHVYGTADFTNVTLIGIENVVVNSNVTFTLDQFRSLSALTFAGTTPHAISVVVPTSTGGTVAVPTAVVQQLISGATIAVDAIPGVTLSAPVTSVAKTISATSPTATVSLGGTSVAVASAGGTTGSTTFKYNGLAVDVNNITNPVAANGLPAGGANAITSFVEYSFIANISGMNSAQLQSIYSGGTDSRYGFIQGTLNWTGTAADLGILNEAPGVDSGVAANNTVSTIVGTANADVMDLRGLKAFDVDPGAGSDTVYLNSSARDTVRLGSGGDDTLHVVSGGSVARGGTTWGVTNADVVYGFASGDTIKIGINPTGAVQSINGLGGTVVGFIRGTWSGTSFSEVVDGADTLVVWDADGAGSLTALAGVVLVGTGATVTGATGVTGGAGG